MGLGLAFSIMIRSFLVYSHSRMRYVESLNSQMSEVTPKRPEPKSKIMGLIDERKKELLFFLAGYRCA